jgi:aminoglycoside phosphotransferase (APT) family kinase protein
MAPGLSAAQQALLAGWLPGAELVATHGWGLTQTSVLQVRHAGRDLIVKAGGPDDGHIARELRAHREWLVPWTSVRRAPELVHGDESAKILVTRWVPGDLVLGQPSADDPDVHRQAGELLARFHAQTSTVDVEYELQQNARTVAWLAGPHRIPDHWVKVVRATVAQWPNDPTVLVPTHGDYQPRNWLLHNGVVHVIDFGRAAMRPAYTDFTRLSYRDFSRNPILERAFIEGYGIDPRLTDAWSRNLVREGVSTAAWAYQVGDEEFEREGLRLLGQGLRSAAAG